MLAVFAAANEVHSTYPSAILKGALGSVRNQCCPSCWLYAIAGDILVCGDDRVNACTYSCALRKFFNIRTITIIENFRVFELKYI